MTAPVVDLTPQDTSYDVLFINGWNPYVNVVNNTPIVLETGFPPLFGNAPIGFKLSPVNPTDGSMYFKMPPTAINCDLVSAEVLTNGIDTVIPINATKGIFIANDGRVVFRPNAARVIIDALESADIGPDDWETLLNGFRITARIEPVYSNPTGERPDYSPITAIIQYRIDGVDLASSGPVDFIDEYPYIGYEAWTRDTPATIAPGVMPD